MMVEFIIKRQHGHQDRSEFWLILGQRLNAYKYLVDRMKFTIKMMTYINRMEDGPVTAATF
jgi:hypothetical protein